MIYIYIAEILICLCCIISIISSNRLQFHDTEITYSAKRDLMGIILIVFLVIIMSNAYYSDLGTYDRWYSMIAGNNYALLRFEKGYGYFSLFCHEYLHLDFKQYLALYVTIALCLIYLSYKKVADSFSFFIFFFMLYEMFFDGIQLRNFAAAAFIIYGLVTLGKPGKKNIILYVLCVIIASLFHASSIAYMVFLVCKIDVHKLIGKIKTNKIITITIIILCAIMLILLERSGVFYLIIANSASSLMDENVVRRIETHSSGIGFTGPMYISILFVLYMLFIIYLDGQSLFSTKSCISKWSIHKGVIRKEFQIIDISYFYIITKRINIIALLFLPFVFMSTTYYRLIRTVCLFDIVYFGSVFDHSKSKNGKIQIFFVTSVLMLLWIAYDLILPGRFFQHIFGYLGVIE